MGKEHYKIPKDELRDLYEKQKLSPYQIANIYGCNHNTIGRRLLAYGIKVRNLSEAQKLRWGVNIPEGELRNFYEKQGLSTSQIAQQYGVSQTTIVNRMKEYHIKARPFPEATIIYPKSDFSGDLIEKAYLIGFRLGDLHVEKPNENGQVIAVSCCSTKGEQIQLFKKLFDRYTHVNVGKPDKEGRVCTTCCLNLSFDFLLPQEDKIEEWILANRDHFIAFVAGYTDAEGYIGISGDQARFELKSYDKNILHQIHANLSLLDIKCPKPSIHEEKGHPNKYGSYQNQDSWRLGVYRRDSLQKLFALIALHLKHAKRRRDMERAKKNVEERLRKFGNKGVH